MAAPVNSDDKPVPRWQKVTAVLYVLALVAEVVVFRSHLGADFVPFDNSHIAPNILASIIIVEVVTPFGVLLWPPTRRRLHRFADRKLAPLHLANARAEAHREWEAHTLAKLHKHVTGLDAPDHPHFKS